MQKHHQNGPVQAIALTIPDRIYTAFELISLIQTHGCSVKNIVLASLDGDLASLQLQVTCPESRAGIAVSLLRNHPDVKMLTTKNKDEFKPKVYAIDEE